jgi:uncharacterized damage-inducible protein DinB
MSSTATVTPVTLTALQTPKEQFLSTYEREHEITMRVLRALPADRGEMQPHPRCRSARDLAWIFVMEQGMLERALTTGFDWSRAPAAPPPAPESMDVIIRTFDAGQKRIAELVRGTPDERLLETVSFFVGPKQLADVPKLQFLWFVLFDQIHHRGQFSIYVRMADARLPSIYGPTADEPWV